MIIGVVITLVELGLCKADPARSENQILANLREEERSNKIERSRVKRKCTIR